MRRFIDFPVINFSQHFFKFNLISGIVLILCVITLLSKGIKYGVDFKGGAEVQIKFSKTVGTNNLRSLMQNDKFHDFNIQQIGEKKDNEFLIKFDSRQQSLNEVTEHLDSLLKNHFQDNEVTIRKTDIVGPKAGAELRKSGFKAMFYALLAIMIYIGLRFDFKYSPGAIIAVIHDLLIIVSLYTLSGRVFTLQAVAALLATIGYSVNDTVVIYDRVREKEELHKDDKLSKNVDLALNETLKRTVLTSSTTLLVAIPLFLWGGGISDFFFIIVLGIIVGTYSSVYIAAPMTLFLDRMTNRR